MTTINTVEDLIRVLDENPQWLEILRARILTREVLELPQRLAELAVASDQRAERHEQSNNARFDSVDQHFDGVNRHLRRIDDTLGYLKGSHARSAALRSAARLARRVGLQRVRNLTEDDLLAITDGVDTTDIPTNALDSFHDADLVMEATDAAGETCYIAVEISFTVNAWDTGRALRNAAFLTRFTGKAAQAAVAGLYQDNEIQQQIESGAVFWHQLSRHDLEAE